MADGRAVVNMAIATSYASIYRYCSEETEKRNISIPSYSWFLLQFWFCSRTVSNIMHCTGKFKVRQMVQARLFRKHNPESHYCNAIYNFMKERAMTHRDTSTLFNVDTKCKVSVGEADFPIASVTRGKKVIADINQLFEVGNHDFSKISVVPDAVFVQKIPEKTKVFKVHGFLVKYFTHLKTW